MGYLEATRAKMGNAGNREMGAPCNPQGEVVTVDNDSKEAICRCPLNPKGCWVDDKNRVIGEL